MQFDRRKLVARIVEKYGSQRKFAEAIGVSESVVSYKLSGRTKISEEDIFLWISPLRLDIPLADIGKYFFTPKVLDSATTM